MSRFADLEGRTDGLIALTGAGEGALARLLAEDQPTPRAGLCRPARRRCSRRPALRRARPARRCGRGRGRGRADRARLCPRPAAGRDQPVLLRRARLPRRARRHAVHRQFDLCRQRRSPARSPARPGSSRADDGGAVRRPARGDRQHAGRRAALRLRGAQAQADPAEPRRRPGGRGGRCCAAMPRAGLEARLDRIAELHGERAELARRLSRPARLRDRRHHPDGLPRLLPDRRRLHQMGQGPRHSGRARAAVRARARSSPGR